MRLVVPVATRLDYEATAPVPPDRDLLDQLAERHSLRGPVRRLLAAMEAAGLAPPAPPPRNPWRHDSSARPSTAGPRCPSERRVGEPVDLVEAWGCGVEVQLGHADVLERAERVAHGPVGGEHAVGDLLGDRTAEAVVVEEVRRAGPLRVRPEREIGERPDPRLAPPVGLLPGRPHALDHRSRGGRAAAARDPALAPPHGPSHGRFGVAADE